MQQGTIKLVTGDEVPVMNEVRYKAQISLKNHEGNLCNAIGVQNITKSNYTEKYTGIKLVLYYVGNLHVSTYNKKTKTAILFY